MKQAGEYCYLGTWISNSGVKESTSLSVSKKIVKVKHLIHETKTVVDDSRDKVAGAF